MHLRVKKDPEVARLGGQSLAGGLLDPYKGIVVRQHLVEAVEDPTIKRLVVLQPEVSCVLGIVEEQLGEDRNLLRARY